MREQLQQYVELLFAGAPDSEDIKQEILQNTLDRYDDLIAQGKVPEAAYRLAIAGIGDISEILGTVPTGAISAPPVREAAPEADTAAAKRKRNRAIAIGLYIICIIPLIVLSSFGLDILGLCATLSIVAVATVAIIQNQEPDDEEDIHQSQKTDSPRGELHKSIRSLIGIITLIVYLAVSFLTGAWYITWLIFPLSGAVKGLIKAILDLKEAVDHEN